MFSVYSKNKGIGLTVPILLEGSVYTVHACLYLYIHNKYTQYTLILCKQILLFWMRLITITSLTALVDNIKIF